MKWRCAHQHKRIYRSAFTWKKLNWNVQISLHKMTNVYPWLCPLQVSLFKIFLTKQCEEHRIFSFMIAECWYSSISANNLYYYDNYIRTKIFFTEMRWIIPQFETISKSRTHATWQANDFDCLMIETRSPFFNRRDAAGTEKGFRVAKFYQHYFELPFLFRGATVTRNSLSRLRESVTILI